jgi:hypothetical protein
VVDSNEIYLSDLPLTLHNYAIQNYKVSGTGIVGTEQNITLTFQLNSYFQAYGGLISVYFPKNSTFVYSTPAAISTSSGSSLVVTPSLYDESMKSLSGLTLEVNCSKSQCGT